MMVINNKFDIKQIVYLVTDPDQLPRMITSMRILPNDLLVYVLSGEGGDTGAYEFEIQEERTVI